MILTDFGVLMSRPSSEITSSGFDEMTLRKAVAFLVFIFECVVVLFFF